MKETSFNIHEATRIINVAPLQHMIALASGFVASQGLERFHIDYLNHNVTPEAQMLTLGAGLFAMIFSEYSAVKKYHEYLKIKSAFERKGWDEKLIEPKSHSWCQRRAVRLAATDVGYLSETDQYFYKNGYRWYHIFPDFT